MHLIKILGQLVLTMTFILNLSHSYRNPFLHPHSECHAACSTYKRRKGKEEIASESELQRSTIHLHLNHLAMTLTFIWDIHTLYKKVRQLTISKRNLTDFMTISSSKYPEVSRQKPTVRSIKW